MTPSYTRVHNPITGMKDLQRLSAADGTADRSRAIDVGGLEL
jgi:hypothetical protein